MKGKPRGFAFVEFSDAQVRMDPFILFFLIFSAKILEFANTRRPRRPLTLFTTVWLEGANSSSPSQLNLGTSPTRTIPIALHQAEDPNDEDITTM